MIFYKQEHYRFSSKRKKKKKALKKFSVEFLLFALLLRKVAPKFFGSKVYIITVYVYFH